MKNILVVAGLLIILSPAAKGGNKVAEIVPSPGAAIPSGSSLAAPDKPTLPNASAPMGTLTPAGRWEVYPSPTRYHLTAVSFIDSDYGWAVGDVILKYENGTWSVFYQNPRYYFLDVDMVSRYDGWAISGDLSEDRYWIWRWNGIIWEIYQETEDPLFCIDMVDRNYGWIGSNNGFYRFAGSRWVKYEGLTHSITGIFMETRNAGRAVGLTYILRCVGGSWFVEQHTTWDVNGIFVLSNGRAWACGSTGYHPQKDNGLLIIHEAGWREYRQFEEARCFYNMDFYGNNFGWCVGDRKNPYPYGAFLCYYNGIDWIEVNAPTNKGLRDVEIIDYLNGWIVGVEGLILKYVPGPNTLVVPTSVGKIKTLFR
jgi:hypothetical protein